MGMAGAGEAQRRRRRQRAYEFLDSTDPERGRALRWCETAMEMHRADGDMKEARLLLRSALICVKDYAPVYRTWIAMEAGRGGSLLTARGLFAEWGARCAADAAAGTKDEDERAGFWCSYLAFELDHGGGHRARDVAEAAAAACPHDAAVRAKCVKAELRLGDAGRARAALHRALDALDGDGGAQEWLVDEVRRYGNGKSIVSERRHGLPGLRGAMKWVVDEVRARVNSFGEQMRHGLALRVCAPFSRPLRGYERLRSDADADESL